MFARFAVRCKVVSSVSGWNDSMFHFDCVCHNLSGRDFALQIPEKREISCMILN